MLKSTRYACRVGHFSGEYFGWKETISTNIRWNGKTRDKLLIPVLYGVEILTDDYFVLSQYTNLTDGHTDGQNCDSNTVRCITCSRTVKSLQNDDTIERLNANVNVLCTSSTQK